MTVVCMIIMAIAPLDLYPVPQEISLLSDKHFSFLSGTTIVVADDATDVELSNFREILDGAGTEFPFVRASEFPESGSAVFLGEYDRLNFNVRRKLKRLLGETRPSDQGYHLIISDKAVIIEGGDPAGTFYGFQTFSSIVKTGREIPCLEVKDGPDLDVRGVTIDGFPHSGQLQKLARMRCNRILFSSEDFFNLTEENADEWRNTFNKAKSLYIEPVPLLDVFNDADPLIQKLPAIAEGHVFTESLFLKGTEAQLLSKQNIINASGSPIRVSISGSKCERAEDYELISDPETELLSIRRVDAGSIPDGAIVDVTYSHVPQGTTSCCPNASGFGLLFHESLQKLVQALNPEYIHLGQGPVEGLNRDLRCLATGKTNAQIFTDAVSLCTRISKDIDSDLKVILWADALNPNLGAAWRGLDRVVLLLPSDIDLNIGDVMLDQAFQSIQWADSTRLEYLISFGKSQKDIYACSKEMSVLKEKARGFIFGDDISLKSDASSLRLAFQKGWAVGTPRLAWPEGLNDYFDAALWEPLFDEMVHAMIDHLNRQTLQGISPRDEYDNFVKFIRELKLNLPKDETECSIITQIYQNLTTYLQLEEVYARSTDRANLRDLIKLVKNQNAIDPDSQEERTEKIISTIQDKRLFVPSTVLFGFHLLPYGKMMIPDDIDIMEIAAKPKISRTDHRIEALYDFPACPGEIYRIDFETVGTAELIIEKSADGVYFEEVQSWTSTRPGGVRGPSILEKPFRCRFLKVTVIAPAERAVLKNLRIFSFKESPKMFCPQVEEPPLLDARLTESMWLRNPDAVDFIQIGEQNLAGEQTSVHMCRTEDTLFIGANMFDDQAGTMNTTQTGRDAALWKEESLEILIDTGENVPYRFIVGPLCAQYDSRGVDLNWNGEWIVATRRHDLGWTAEIAIPFKTLQISNPRNKTWRVNFIRNRRNTQNETSVWSTGKGNLNNPVSFGELVF